MKQQAEKNKRTQPNFGEGVGGSPCRIHRKFTYETAHRKNKRTQPNFGEGVGGSPCQIQWKFTYETASRKTNARDRTSEWELEGAPAGLTDNSCMKQQAGKQTHAAEPR